MSNTFTNDVTNALVLLQNVLPSPNKPGALKPDMLDDAKAIQFVTTNKTGLGLGLTTGGGFTIAKLGTNDDRTVKWSAPCFLTVTSLSLGATIGTQDGGTLSLAMSDVAADVIKEKGFHASVGAEASLTVLDFVATGRSWDAFAQQDIVTVGWQDGVFADLSAAVGGLKTDSAKNAEVYGRPIEPREILGGEVAPANVLFMFEDLYNKLNENVMSGRK